MFDYRSILLYYSKGNNNSQIARLCSCTRKTVIKTIKIALEKGIQIPVPNSINDNELAKMLFPNRSYNEEYEMPNFEWEKFNMTKHRVSIDLAWKRYVKRCIRENKKPYCRARFYTLFKEYLKPSKAERHLEMINKLESYNYALNCLEPDSDIYLKIKQEKEDWLKSVHLDEEKI